VAETSENNDDEETLNPKIVGLSLGALFAFALFFIAFTAGLMFCLRSFDRWKLRQLQQRQSQNSAPERRSWFGRRRGEPGDAHRHTDTDVAPSRRQLQRRAGWPTRRINEGQDQQLPSTAMRSINNLWNFVKKPFVSRPIEQNSPRKITWRRWRPLSIFKGDVEAQNVNIESQNEAPVVELTSTCFENLQPTSPPPIYRQRRADRDASNDAFDIIAAGRDGQYVENEESALEYDTRNNYDSEYVHNGQKTPNFPAVDPDRPYYSHYIIWDPDNEDEQQYLQHMVELE
jgi:hypothetical protein